MHIDNEYESVWYCSAEAWQHCCVRVTFLWLRKVKKSPWNQCSKVHNLWKVYLVSIKISWNENSITCDKCKYMAWKWYAYSKHHLYESGSNVFELESQMEYNHFTYRLPILFQKMWNFKIEIFKHQLHGKPILGDKSLVVYFFHQQMPIRISHWNSM